MPPPCCRWLVPARLKLSTDFVGASLAMTPAHCRAKQAAKGNLVLVQEPSSGLAPSKLPQTCLAAKLPSFVPPGTARGHCSRVQKSRFVRDLASSTHLPWSLIVRWKERKHQIAAQLEARGLPGAVSPFPSKGHLPACPAQHTLRQLDGSPLLSRCRVASHLR